MSSPRHSFLAWLTALLLLAVSAGSATAQKPEELIGKPIAQMRLLLDGRETHDPDILRVLETRQGATYQPIEVRESIVHLMAMGRFEDVRAYAEPLPPGVRITYELIPLRSVKDFEFRGDLGVSVRTLRGVLAERYTRIPPVSRAEEMARALESFYHGRGYLKAKVQPRVERSQQGKQVTLVFEVAAGPEAVVGAVLVEGAPNGDVAAVQSRLGLSRGSGFDREALERRITRYVTELQSRGYADARVEPEFAYSTNLEHVDVTIRMNVGAPISVAFTGDPLPPGSRAEADRLRRDPTTDEDTLEDAQARIEGELRAEGYRDALVTFRREQRDPGEQILFTVKRGRQYRVANLEITGNAHVPLSILRPTPRLDSGDWFVKSKLDADVATITDAYHRRGYREAKVTAVATPRVGDVALLDVQLQVAEGPRTAVGAITFEGNTLPESTLRARVKTNRGDPFYQPQVADDRDSVQTEYLNRGYQLATVEVQPSFSADASEVSLKFAIHEGPQIFVDHILVVGNVRTKSSIIEREINLHPGMPISIIELADAQRRLSALGLFRRVEVRELQRGSETRRDVLVMVEEAPPTTVAYGAGFEVLRRLKADPSGSVVPSYEFTPRGSFEIGRRNLWGKNRSVNLFTRVAVRSSDEAGSSSSTGSSGSSTIAPLTDTSSGFREYRVLATYREPRIFGSAVDVSVNALAEQAIRSSFDFRRSQLLVEGSHRFGPRVSLAGRYTLGRARIFNSRVASDKQLDIDRLFPQVRLSSFSSTVTRDTRNDLLEPSHGTLLLFDGTVAARRLGSEVGFLKGVWQGFGFTRLPGLGSTVLALGVRVGLASGLPRYLPGVDDAGNPIQIKVQDIPASERFFAGGDNTLRGFVQDQLGAANTLDRNGVPTGGNALLLLNTELRFPILSKLGLGGAAFVDVGNVFLRVNDISLGELRTGIGGGIRWKSPVGPLRIDLGWKVNRHTFNNGQREDRFVPYISIGQAF